MWTHFLFLSYNLTIFRALTLKEQCVTFAQRSLVYEVFSKKKKIKPSQKQTRTEFKPTPKSASDKVADGYKDILSSFSIGSQKTLILKGVF